MTEQQSKLRILLAEDDEHLAEVIRLTLEHLGYNQVTIVSDGASALREALRQNFDLLILDYLMPAKDGISVCREYRAYSQNPAPVFILSARSEDSDIQEALKAGASGHIAKPFKAEEISEKINAVLARRK